MSGEGMDLTGKATQSWLFGSFDLPDNTIVVADESLAEMYGVKTGSRSFRELKQDILSTYRSEDPRQVHLALLLVRNSETEATGVFLGEYIIWTKEIWDDFARQYSFFSPDDWNHGFMVGEVVNAFARYFHDADYGVLTRLQDIDRVGWRRRMQITPWDADREIPSGQSVIANMLGLVLQRWPSYRIQNGDVFKAALAHVKLSSEQFEALSTELWAIIKGTLTIKPDIDELATPAKAGPASAVPSDSVSRLLSEGVRLKRQGDYAAAKKVYLEAIQLDPTDLDTFYALAKICYLTREPAEALMNYIRVCHLSMSAEVKNLTDPVFRAIVESKMTDFSSELVSRLLAKHPVAISLLIDPNTPCHAAHALIDFDPNFPKPPLGVAHIANYRSALTGQANQMNYDIEDPVYRPIGVEYLADRVRWDQLDNRNVLSLYRQMRHS